jgi:hypothetical protein
MILHDMIWYDMLWYDIIYDILYAGESNGNLPLRTCPGCSVPEPYRSPDWVLVPAKPAEGLNTNEWILYDIWHYMVWYMLWYDMIWYDIWYDMWYDIICDTIWYVIRYDMNLYMIWYDDIWYVVIWNFENLLIHRCNYILLSQVYCVWQVVKTPTVIFNNPVYK